MNTILLYSQSDLLMMGEGGDCSGNRCWTYRSDCVIPQMKGASLASKDLNQQPSSHDCDEVKHGKMAAPVLSLQLD
jgi:hypothetical protein